MSRSDDDVSEENDLKNDSSVEILDVNTSSIDNKLNVKDNVVKMLDNSLQGNSVRLNVMDWPGGSLQILKYLYCQKDVIVKRTVPTSNTIDKAKLKTELETLARILGIKQV